MNLKNVRTAGLGLFVAVVLSTGVAYSQSDAYELSIANARALTEEVAGDALVGNAECLPTSQNKCTVRTPNGILLEGTGQPHVTW